jgi:serine/threonine-protein kinase
MSNSPPSTLGKYQIIREIARSNDIVFEAYDPLMNRRVALKELAMPGGSTPQQREDRINRFKREAQAAGTLNHPNIMTVYELGQEGDRLFMAMEFLDGHTLRNEIDTKGFLPVDRAIEVVMQILDGLEHAHKLGVVHRDIKPDNIQILSNGNIKITDFGIARLTFQPNLTMDGQVFGTPSYMSPEQVVGKDIDQRSDLFSVGILLYEMISGHKPFGGDSVVTITYAIMNKEAERLNQIPYPLWQVIERTMDKSPALRYSNASELRAALEGAQSASASGTMAPMLPPVQQTGGFHTGYAPGNPYAGSYGAPPQMPSPQPPPLAYPYNPYSQPGQTGMPPHSLPGAFNNVPIYYPPPPRQPLFKPETKQFFGKLFVSLIIMGSLFALILVGINGISQALERTSNSREDAAVITQINKIDSNLPIEEQISRLQGLVSQLKGDVARKETRAKIAALYERLGKRASNRGDMIGAENAFQSAIENDSENALLYTNLGALYVRRAEAERETKTKIPIWQQASEAWRNAATYEANPRQKSLYAEQAAICYYNLAYEMRRDGGFLMQEVRSTLYVAQGYAPPGSEVERQIQLLFDQLRN